MSRACTDLPEGPQGAVGWARQRLGELGREVEAAGPIAWPPAAAGLGSPREEESTAASWARSGALALVGPPAHPVLPRAPLPHVLEGALAALRTLAPVGDWEGLDARLLGERAAWAGASRRGSMTVGGSGRFVATADGWIAPNLPREDDWRLVPAWIETAVAPRDWEALAAAVGGRPRCDLVLRGRELGLAIGSPEPALPARPWCIARQLGVPRDGPLRRNPLVVDLSALWAGPLCTDLLRRAGAQVVKIESSARPDGARGGPAGFFDLLHAGKRCVALDLSRDKGRAALSRLIAAADVVVESARPRALAQLGIEAPVWLAARPGRVWCSITGYGRDAPWGGWVGFGDDAAVSAGLQAYAGSVPLFVGDAIADPLAGVHAALAVTAVLRSGGGRLVDVALAAVVRCSLGSGTCADPSAAWVELEAAGPRVVERGRSWPVEPPRRRQPWARARALGADTREVLAQLGIGPWYRVSRGPRRATLHRSTTGSDRFPPGVAIRADCPGRLPAGFLP